MYNSIISCMNQLFWPYNPRQALDQNAILEVIEEHIVNFTIFGKQQMEPNEPHYLFVQGLRDALLRETTIENPYEIPEELVVNYKRCTVTFIRSHYGKKLDIIKVRIGTQNFCSAVFDRGFTVPATY